MTLRCSGLVPDVAEPMACPLPVERADLSGPGIAYYCRGCARARGIGTTIREAMYLLRAREVMES